MNARDLSEPPRTGRPRDAPLRRNITITEDFCTRNKGTASGGLVAVRFWVGVAQITRRCDRAFSASICFIQRIFRIGPIRPQDRCASSPVGRVFPFPHGRFAPIVRQKPPLRDPNMPRMTGRSGRRAAGKPDGSTLLPLISALLPLISNSTVDRLCRSFRQILQTRLADRQAKLAAASTALGAISPRSQNALFCRLKTNSMSCAMKAVPNIAVHQWRLVGR